MTIVEWHDRRRRQVLAGQEGALVVSYYMGGDPMSVDFHSALPVEGGVNHPGCEFLEGATCWHFCLIYALVDRPADMSAVD